MGKSLVSCFFLRHSVCTKFDAFVQICTFIPLTASTNPGYYPIDTAVVRSSYGPVSVFVRVCRSLTETDEQIELILAIEISFYVSYTVL